MTNRSSPVPVSTRMLGRAGYAPTEAAMRAFTETRTPDSPDEIWLCEHPPVYTQGLAGKAEHVLAAHGVPVVQTSREQLDELYRTLSTHPLVKMVL